MSDPRWIWQTKDWPRFHYDHAALSVALSLARQAQGKLLGKADAVGLANLGQAQRDIWIDDALATSAIEGETLNIDAVRSSVARRLGIASSFVAAAPRNIEGLLDTMEDAAARWDSDLTPDRLCLWQAALFQDNAYAALKGVKVGAYRDDTEPMQIVSGPQGHETVHYQAPSAAAVPAEMRLFIDWFNRSRTSQQNPNNTLPLDGIVRAGLAHLWFEVIHPFDDGNGRVGRAIVDMALAQDVKLPYRLHGVSQEMHRRQAAYYAALNVASVAGDDGRDGTYNTTAWLLWFVDAFHASCESAARLIDESLQRARFWSDHRQADLNDRQRKVLNKMLEAGPGEFVGGMTARKYVSMTGITAITATRDLTELLARGLVTRKGDGRSTYYDLAIPGWEWIPMKHKIIKLQPNATD